MIGHILVFCLGGGILSFLLIFLPFSYASEDHYEYVNSRMKIAKEGGASRIELDLIFAEVMNEGLKYKHGRVRYYSFWGSLILLPLIFIYAFKFSKRSFNEFFVVAFFSMIGYMLSSGNLLALVLIPTYLIGLNFQRKRNVEGM